MDRARRRPVGAAPPATRGLATARHGACLVNIARRDLPHVRVGSRPTPAGSSAGGRAPALARRPRPRQASPAQAHDRRTPGPRPGGAAAGAPAIAASAPRPRRRRPVVGPERSGSSRDERSPPPSAAEAARPGPRTGGDGGRPGPKRSRSSPALGDGGTAASKARSAGTWCASTSSPTSPRSPCSRGGRWSSTTCRGRPTTPTRSTATSTGAGSRTCCPGMEAAFVDIGIPKNAVLYRGDVRYDRDDVEGGGGSGVPAPDRGRAAAGADHPVPGDQEPDRGQGGPPHPGGLAARALRRAGAQLERLRDLQAPGRQRAAPAAPDRRRRAAGRPRPDRAHRGRGGPAGRAAPRRRPPARAVGRPSRPRPSRSDAPGLLYREPDLAVRILREELNGEYRGVVIDDRALYEQVRDYVAGGQPRAGRPGRVLRHRGRGPADLRALPRARAAAQGARPQGLAALGGLAHHRADRGAHRDRRQHRQERRARPTSRRPSTATTSRRPRRSPASCGCATSAGSSSSTSSTWRSGRTGTRWPPRCATPWPGTRPAPRSSTSPSWAWSR